MKILQVKEPKTLGRLCDHEKVSKFVLVFSHGDFLGDVTKLMTVYLDDNSMEHSEHLDFGLV